MDSDVLTSKRDDLQKLMQDALNKKAQLEQQHAQVCRAIDQITGALQLVKELEVPAEPEKDDDGESEKEG